MRRDSKSGMVLQLFFYIALRVIQKCKEDRKTDFLSSVHEPKRKKDKQEMVVPHLGTMMSYLLPQEEGRSNQLLSFCFHIFC